MKEILFVLTLLSFSCFGQINADSLLSVAENEKEHDTTRISAIGSLSVDYYVYFNLDSALYYAQLEEKYSKSIGYSKGIANGLTHQGEAYRKQGEVDLAVENNLEALQIFERIDNKVGQVAALISVGNLYLSHKNLEKANEYISRANEIEQTYLRENEVGKAESSLAGIHAQMGMIDEAILELEELIVKAEASENHLILATLQSNLGGCYYYKLDMKTALKWIELSSQSFEEAGNYEGAIMTLQNMGNVFKVQGDLNKSLRYNEKAIELAKKYEMLNMLEQVTYETYQTYAELGKYQKAYETVITHMSAKDSMKSLSNEKALIEKEVQYNYDKKQFEDSLQFIKNKELDDLAHQSEIASEERKQYVLFGGVGVLFVIGLILLRGNQRKKRDNQTILEQKEKVEQQKSIIEEVHKEITDSISYAKRIQSAILPPIGTFGNVIPNSFVLYKPKDIVAGDFYWTEQLQDGVLVAAADCTGHGVPGAMVSVICNNALNRAVREFELKNPGEILDKVREIVIEEFSKSEEQVNDGMDISLILLRSNELLFAGANNPLWISRGTEILEFKGDKQPIGKFQNPTPFNTHKVKLEKDDQIYLFSDGYADQFGGDKGKKFKSKNLKTLLMSVQSLSMNDQKKQINKTFEDWKGGIEQLDDVCIIGIKV